MATNTKTQTQVPNQARRDLELWLQRAASLLAQQEIAEAAERYEAKLRAWKIGGAL